ncbi:UBX domain-containing protein [Encephalitozoon cuniculi]|nr:UBX domain-containing protein [Encephalitozoon cuniculi]
MEGGNKTETSDEEVVKYLVQSGFTREEVQNAMKGTGSRDIDILVNFIISSSQNRAHGGVKQAKKVNNNKASKEAIDLEKRRKEELMKEKLYREQLINQIKADMAEKLEKERLEDERLMSTNVEKSEDISDCKIKLWVGDGTSLILGFSKNDTIEDLFRRIEAKLNKKRFNLFKMNHVTPVERSTKKISEIPGLYPRGVLFIEE